jgi:mannose-1-phosphate guanylyltransferase/phosphomannomutase
MNESYRRLLGDAPNRPLPGISAVVLAGGAGSRLTPFTRTIPKPLLPVLNLPLLLWTMARFGRAGLATICANVCYLPDAFQDVQAMSEGLGPRLRIVREARPTGPLGGLISCSPALPESDTCVIVSGDALYDIDLRALIAAHRRSQSDLTLTTRLVQGAERYGVLDVDPHGYVVRMREKPQTVRQWEHVSCGLYVMSRQLLSSLTPREDSEPYDFIDLVSSMLASRSRIATYELQSWHDVSTPADLLAANMTYLSTDNLTQIASRRARSSHGELWTDASIPVPRQMNVAGRVLLGKGATVATSARLSNVVVGAGATILSNAEISSSVVMPCATVLSGARVSNEVVTNT